MLRIVQVQKDSQRRIAVVDEPSLCLIDHFDCLYSLAIAAIKDGKKLSTLVQDHLTQQKLDYDSIYIGQSNWRLMIPLDHPDGPAHTLVSGTGLTHFGSARDRHAMHAKVASDDEQNLTDSMKMFRWGVQGGRPQEGQIGISPEWFYKGNGNVLRAHGQALDIPNYAEDGGEEAEIAGLYIIDPDHLPRRVGMATGNEFADHEFEKRNYLNLAGSKMRTCSIGPEIVIDPNFDLVAGEVMIERGGKSIWSKPVRTGESEMSHSLANIEHHHFKFETHRQTGDVHVHYFGAHSLSFGDGVRLLDSDVMAIRWDGFGRPLRNPVHLIPKVGTKPITPISLG